ncbi:UNVERIFIED_CONTAM: putative protein YtfP [Sesamum latifolium]|uniref:FAD/NAD(P)-binding oxidoreductase family protein n=1 Tax=Sesamum latifolium TaxID=2727402 RepID=A0AAW2Y7A1_9LAMI
MNAFPRFVLHNEILSKISTSSRNYAYFLSSNHRRRYCAVTLSLSTKPAEETLVVIGGGAAGMYGAIRAKTVAPDLNVFVIEKGKPLSKVRISGGGRCNVTNGHCLDNVLAFDHVVSDLEGNYPRGNKELRGSFFSMHGPTDTMSWFSDRGVQLKTEVDGRVFPISNSSSTIIDCLMSEAKNRGVVLQTGKAVTSVSTTACGKFSVKIEKRTVNYVEYIEANYVMIASGSSEQGYKLAAQLGHSIVKPVPSLFTFKIDDFQLVELSGVTFPKVRAKLKLETVHKSIPEHTQVGPMLVTHWGFSGPVILRLSAWAARELSDSDYKGSLVVDFVPDLHIEDVKAFLVQHKNKFAGQFKDEFVTAGGVPLSENAWSGGYIAGTSIGNLATAAYLKEEAA